MDKLYILYIINNYHIRNELSMGMAINGYHQYSIALCYSKQIRD